MYSIVSYSYIFTVRTYTWYMSLSKDNRFWCLTLAASAHAPAEKHTPRRCNFPRRPCSDVDVPCWLCWPWLWLWPWSHIQDSVKASCSESKLFVFFFSNLRCFCWWIIFSGYENMQIYLPLMICVSLILTLHLTTCGSSSNWSRIWRQIWPQ